MQLKTTITFAGKMSEILSDLEAWKRADPQRTKLCQEAPTKLKFTISNYATKADHKTTISAQRTFWQEEASKVPRVIAEEIAE